MKRPRVLVLGPSLQAVSGVSTHVNMLLGSALAHQFRLAHFQVGSEGRAERPLRRAARLAASPFVLAWAILRRGAHIVHVNTSLDARAYWRDALYVLVAKLCGARVVYQVHGGALPGEFFHNRILRGLLRAVLRWPDAVLVLASKELEAYQAFVPGQSVILLPNGIDCAPYAAAPRRATQARRPLRLIYLGRLAPGKGLDELIEALALARGRGVTARLVIAGSGSEQARLRERVRSLDLAREVSFVGAAFGARKARLLGASDAMTLPSYSEGLPYALLEAMAAGAVPIATCVGAIPDVVKHEAHGILVPPADAGAIADAIVALDADRPRLERMRAACRQRVAASYSMGRVAADLAGLYSGLCAARAPRAAL